MEGKVMSRGRDQSRERKEGGGGLQDGYVVVDLGLVPLGDALGDPDNVSALLLLEAEVRVEDAVVELLEERVHVQLHLVLKELVLERLLARIVLSIKSRVLETKQNKRRFNTVENKFE
jgi:hypothetical protein